MYIRLSSFLPVAALAAVVAAAPSNLVVRQSSECNTGSIVCCQSTSTASSPATASLLGLLGIVIQDLTELIGIGCSPIGVLSSTSCTQQPVCCNNDSFNGLIVIGCSPITINL